MTYTWHATRAGYIHVADTKGSLAITTNDDVITNVHAGDGAFIRGGEKVVIVGGEEKSEFVLFDMLSVQ